MLPERSTMVTNKNTAATDTFEQLEDSLSVLNVGARSGRHRSMYSLDIDELNAWDVYINVQKSPEALIQVPAMAIRLCRALHVDFCNILNDHLNYFGEGEAQPEDRMIFLSQDNLFLLSLLCYLLILFFSLLSAKSSSVW
jgi:hypothetical protein